MSLLCAAQIEEGQIGEVEEAWDGSRETWVLLGVLMLTGSDT